MNFKEEKIARRVSDKFNNNTYTNRGHTVSAERPRLNTSEPGQWTVMLRNVEGKVKGKHIRRSIRHEHEKPNHIEMSPALESFDNSEISTFVESLFTGIGPVRFELGPPLKRRRVQAVARFEEDSDAREAVQKLHDQPQDFLNGGRLTVQLANLAKFKIRLRYTT